MTDVNEPPNDQPAEPTEASAPVEPSQPAPEVSPTTDPTLPAQQAPTAPPPFSAEPPTAPPPFSAEPPTSPQAPLGPPPVPPNAPPPSYPPYYGGTWGPPPEHPAPHRSGAMRVVATVAALALAWGVAATAVAIRNRDNNSGPSLSSRNSFQAPSNGSSSGSLDVNAIATKVSPGVVNISTDLSQGNEAAGTGIVLSSDGEVLTNNHVIRGATKLSVEVGVTGETHTAHVVGYDVADDIALVKVDGVSNLNPVKLANSSNVNTNDPIVAIGNALGRGGAPTAVGGVVTDLGQTITAGDSGDTTNETLTNMIQIQAPIQPGDSGGPLVDASGKVIGVTTAADSTAGGFGRATSGNTGFAIPINKAKSIADQIGDRQASANVHIGARALLGVSTSDQDASNQGAYVEGVQSGSGADNAGIQAQDIVTAINGNDVADADSLRAALSTFHPGDSVRVTYVDPGGSQHEANVKLGTGTPD